MIHFPIFDRINGMCISTHGAEIVTRAARGWYQMGIQMRKYGELSLPTFAPPKSPADNSYLLPDFEVDSGGL